MAGLIYSAIASADGSVGDAAESFGWGHQAKSCSATGHQAQAGRRAGKRQVKMVEV